MTAPRFDHLMYGGPRLEVLVDEVEAAVGVRAAYGGRHSGAGTHNALLGLGDGRYLELIAPVPDEPPDSPLAGLLTALPEPRCVLWAARVPSVESAAAAATERGYDPGSIVELSRTPPGGEELAWRFTFGGTDVLLGVVPFLIEWTCRAHPADTAPTGCTLTDFRAEHPEPDRIAAALSALSVDLPVRSAATPALRATVAGPAGSLHLR